MEKSSLEYKLQTKHNEWISNFLPRTWLRLRRALVVGLFGPETLKAGPKIAPSLPGSLGRQTEVAVWSSTHSGRLVGPQVGQPRSPRT